MSIVKRFMIDSAQKWFWKIFTRDLFIAGIFLWLILFVLEVIKPGIVSNYISLPHGLALLAIIGITALAVHPSKTLQITPGLSQREKVFLAFISIFILITLPLIIEASLALTLALIFVTLAALWIGSILLKT